MLTMIKIVILSKGISRFDKFFVDYNTKSLVNDNPRKILNGDLLTFDIEYDSPSDNLSFLTRLKRKINIT